LRKWLKAAFNDINHRTFRIGGRELDLVERGLQGYLWFQGSIVGVTVQWLSTLGTTDNLAVLAQQDPALDPQSGKFDLRKWLKAAFNDRLIP
jgi:hypothetical protein